MIRQAHHDKHGAHCHPEPVEGWDFIVPHFEFINLRHAGSRLSGKIWKLFGVCFLYLVPLFAFAQSADVYTKCGEGELCHPFFNLKGGLLELLGTALQLVMGLVGVVSFIMVILGAVRWMTAGGNSESVEKGKGMIVWAFLGLALAAASFAILDVFFTGLQKAFYSA